MVSRPFVAIAAIAVVLLATPCCLGQMAEPRFIAFDQKFFRRMDPGVKQVIGFTAFAFDFASFDDVRAHDVRTHRARCSQAAGETGRGEGCVTVRVFGAVQQAGWPTTRHRCTTTRQCYLHPGSVLLPRSPTDTMLPLLAALPHKRPVSHCVCAGGGVDPGRQDGDDL